MPRIPNTTNAQSTFLRAFRSNPAGPPPESWPSPAVLRRWLRRPGFCRAMRAVEQGLRFRADFLLATASARAAERITANPDAIGDDPKRIIELLRLLHVRQRFTADAEDAPALARTAAPRNPTAEDDDRLFTQRFTDPNCAFNALQEMVDDPHRIRMMMQLRNLRGDHRFDRYLLNFPDCAHMDLQPPPP